MIDLRKIKSYKEISEADWKELRAAEKENKLTKEELELKLKFWNDYSVNYLQDKYEQTWTYWFFKHSIYMLLPISIFVVVYKIFIGELTIGQFISLFIYYISFWSILLIPILSIRRFLLFYRKGKLQIVMYNFFAKKCPICLYVRYWALNIVGWIYFIFLEYIWWHIFVFILNNVVKFEDENMTLEKAWEEMIKRKWPPQLIESYLERNSYALARMLYSVVFIIYAFPFFMIFWVFSIFYRLILTLDTLPIKEIVKSRLIFFFVFISLYITLKTALVILIFKFLIMYYLITIPYKLVIKSISNYNKNKKTTGLFDDHEKVKERESILRLKRYLFYESVYEAAVLTTGGHSDVKNFYKKIERMRIESILILRFKIYPELIEVPMDIFIEKLPPSLMNGRYQTLFTFDSYRFVSEKTGNYVKNPFINDEPVHTVRAFKIQDKLSVKQAKYPWQGFF